MSSSEVEIWAPTGADVLRGTFLFYEDIHRAVRADDGTVWLLGDDAEEQLRALKPDEGQPVQVMFMQQSSRQSRYLVSVHSTQQSGPRGGTGSS